MVFLSSRIEAGFGLVSMQMFGWISPFLLLPYENTRFALENGFAPVVGTTGFTEAQIQELTDLSKDKVYGWIDCS